MPLLNTKAFGTSMPIHGNKYFYYRFALAGAGEVNLIPQAVIDALPFGVIRARIAVMEASSSATLRVNGVPADVATGKILRNSGQLAAGVFLREPHEIAMHVTQLSAQQVGETGCNLEVEYWSGQA